MHSNENERVREIKNASFTTLLFSTNGATGEEASHFHKVLAEKLSEKTKSTRRSDHVHSKADLLYHHWYSAQRFERQKEKCLKDHTN